MSGMFALFHSLYLDKLKNRRGRCQRLARLTLSFFFHIKCTSVWCWYCCWSGNHSSWKKSWCVFKQKERYTYFFYIKLELSVVVWNYNLRHHYTGIREFLFSAGFLVFLFWFSSFFSPPFMYKCTGKFLIFLFFSVLVPSFPCFLWCSLLCLITVGIIAEHHTCLENNDLAQNSILNNIPLHFCRYEWKIIVYHSIHIR